MIVALNRTTHHVDLIQLVYTGCIKILYEISVVNSPHQNNGNVHNNRGLQTLNFRGRAPKCAEHNTWDFYLWGHLKTLLYSTPISNEDTLHQRIFYACRNIRNRPETSEMLRQSVIRRAQCVHWFKYRTFREFIVNCDLLNSNNSSFIELGKCTVNVSCQLSVKYYMY